MFKVRLTLWTNFILLILCLMLIAVSCSVPKGNTPVSFYVNGEKVKKPPAVDMVDGEPMVPASFLETTFQSKLEWTLKDPGSSGVYYSDKVAVLMYHDLIGTSVKKTMIKGAEAESAIPMDVFKEQMELLKADGFHIITIDQYADFIENKGNVPDNAVLLTFDDGYESFYTEAFPVLKEHGYPAVNFVIGSGADNAANPKQKARPKMTWDQMREMQKSGMSFYNHTYDSHKYGVMRADGLTKPVLTRHQYLKKEKRVETDEEYHARVKTDLEKAEQRLKEELGNTRGVIAFPYGAYNAEVLDILKEVGISISFTVKEGINGRGQTNGFRLNGARAGESAKQLLEKLKALDLNEAAVTVHVDGKEAAFKEQPYKGPNGVMIPLKEYCKMKGMKLHVSKWKKQYKITA
ncbi:poly-beta-1,6-N-acetyl-D-glucosamine N-deacetylase PgaB [Paenibacillus catalpae]|uniref:Poly-beta-1,6-N-acetyl-D-glucosamine N-deacetylase PgaB n=1 Tax=Paenibacillus catalpae TaxID=1045775 RepID=A0A1I2GUJ7_9BACL|nr:polysaccharide deacetylase family protein [Paenibacillus catalpae]SFF21315.1 poly-beta-1,6-N-acetyl-D-glucosamine N-deacetylase PgaB [Paenibacillus catalpae]